MPEIEKRITTGNIWSIIGTIGSTLVIIAGLFVWGGRQSQRLDTLQANDAVMQTTLVTHETRIRAIETSSARQDERLLLILDSVRKIEAKLERDPK
ncbi:hypothetical protein PARHAE_01119 [Paracoccus haematequi]|uniref:Uncharacterized protein n=1 Tax=Paracoccus haematequi TaxID=2491866 RepID=A0A447IKE4_9RHOB|nr:hypothetical protein [Paracoccus haematequi]VDS07939.1 hypothetical protein PARHAE_01119 [Paracoccus haematequi]